jgi:hypothetical protein
MTGSVSQKIARTLYIARKSLHWLLYAREEMNLKQRDVRFQELAKEKVFDGALISSRELLEADFGSLDINGLSITNAPETLCKIQDMRRNPDYESLTEEEKRAELIHVAGRAGAGEDIFIHPRYFDEQTLKTQIRGFSNTLSHEHIHRLQASENETGWSSAFWNPNMLFLKMPEYNSGIKGKAKNLIGKIAKQTFDKHAHIKTGGHFNVTNYFSKEYEIQARLHELMVQGHTSWQKLPANKCELWAALNNLGLKMPIKYRIELHASEEGRAALREFKVSPVLRYSARHTIRDLNYISDYIGYESKRETFWNEALPAIYSNLIELYGDGPGRERFGFGPNPLPARNVLQALNDPYTSMDQNTIDKLVSLVPPERANELVTVLMSYCDNETGDLEKGEKALEIIEALFAHKYISEALLSQYEFRVTGLKQGMPAYWSAIVYGKTSVLEKYLTAGLDLSVSINIVGFDGKQASNMDLVELAQKYKDFKEYFDGTKPVPKQLRKSFNDQTHVEGFKDFLIKAETSFRCILEHYPALDNDFSYLDGDQKINLTIRKVLSSAGIGVQPSDQSSIKVSETVNL